MTRILITGKPAWFEKDSHGAISFYRILTPLQELARTHGISVYESGSAFGADILKADIVFLHTPNNQLAINAAITAKQWGKKIWADFDDLVFEDDIPKANIAWTFFGQPENKKILKGVMSLVDAVSVSTQVIKDRIIELYNIPDEKIWVIPNALPDQFWKKRNEFKLTDNREIKRLLWRGSVTHEGDLLMAKNGIKPYKKIGYHFIGHYPWMLHKDYDGHLEYITFTKWAKPTEEYFKFLLHAAPHYVFVPLENCLFNKGKSNIAWLEATLAGAACIAPAFMPEFSNVPCILFTSNKSLDGVIKNIDSGADLRTDKYMESRAVIEKNYLLSITNLKRMELIKSLL